MKTADLLLLSLTLLTFETAPSLGGEARADEPGRDPRSLGIVAFGDSTTAPRGAVPVYAEHLRQTLTAKGWKGKVVNAGVGGNTTDAGRARFAKDVLVHRPDIVIVQFGINDSAVDVWKSPPVTETRVSIERYEHNLVHFVDSARAQGCHVILMTPNPVRWTPALKQRYGQPPYRPDLADGFNLILQNYAERVRQVAQRKQVPLVDVYTAFQEYGDKEGQAVDDLLIDGMHPNAQGHRLVAEWLTSVIAEVERASPATAVP